MDGSSYDRNNRPDLSAFWMPFTANRQFKANPRLLVSASGMYYRDEDGREILDGTSGLWCCNLGHARPEIAEAVSRQLMTLDYAPSFQMGHPIAFDFAAALAKIAPAGLDRIFFTNSGSESVDTALKIALAYHRARGQGQRTRLIGREKGYHGVGFGGITVGGLVNNRKTFVLLPGADHIRHTHDPARNAFARGQPAHGAERADDLEQLIALHGAETIAAVIVEPVAGSAGRPAAAGRLPGAAACDLRRPRDPADLRRGHHRLRAPGRPVRGAILRRHTRPDDHGQGHHQRRAADGRRLRQPDGARRLMNGPENAIELFHGYTYSGHPVACAAGLATLEIYRRDGLFNRAEALSAVWESAAHGLDGARHVTDVRNIGLMAAIELAPRPEAPGARGYDALVKGLEAGVLFRATGDTIALSPPLVVNEEEIGRAFEVLSTILGQID